MLQLFKLNGDEAKIIVDKLHGTEMNGRRINVVMTCLTTPTKVRKREVVTLDSTGDTSGEVEVIDPNPNAVVAATGATGAKAKTTSRKANAADRDVRSVTDCANVSSSCTFSFLGSW